MADKRYREQLKAETIYIRAIEKPLREWFSGISEPDTESINEWMDTLLIKLNSKAYQIDLWMATDTMYRIGRTHAMKTHKKHAALTHRKAAEDDELLESEDYDVINEKAMYALSAIAVSVKEAGKNLRTISREFNGSLAELEESISSTLHKSSVSIRRYLRTMATEIYNQAITTAGSLLKADGYVFHAVGDDRTSDICNILNGTIWNLTSSAVRRPPLHFHCRSHLELYYGSVPAPRDFYSEFGEEEVKELEAKVQLFQTKYWGTIKPRDLISPKVSLPDIQITIT